MNESRQVWKAVKFLLNKHLTRIGIIQLLKNPILCIVLICTAVAMTIYEEFLFTGIVIAVLVTAWLAYTDQQSCL